MSLKDRNVARLGAVFLASCLLLSIPTSASAAPANDGVDSPQSLSGESGSVQGSNVAATTDGVERWLQSPYAGGSSVWFSWVAPSTGRVSFDTHGSDIDTLLAVFHGDASATEWAFSDNVDLLGASQVSRMVQAGDPLLIAVDGQNREEGNFLLNWERPPPPTDDFMNAGHWWGIEDAAPERRSLARDNFHATSEVGEPLHAGQVGGKSIWFVLRVPKDGKVHIDTVGSGFDTLLAVYTGGPVDALTPVVSDDDSAGGGMSEVTFQASTDAYYKIAVDGKAGASGDIRFNYTMQPAQVAVNDDFAQATTFTKGYGMLPGNNDGATREVGEAVEELAAGATVWYRWKAPVTGGGHVRLNANNHLLVAAYRGATLENLTEIKRAMATPANLRFPIKKGRVYSFAVDAQRDYPDEATGPFKITWQAYLPDIRDDFADARGVHPSAGAWRWGRTFGGSSEPGEPTEVGRPFASTWYTWTAPETARYRFRLDWLGVGTGRMTAWRGRSLESLSQMAVSDPPISGKSRMDIQAKAGRHYLIQVASPKLDAGYYGIRWLQKN